jgi:betaine reductase
MSRIQVVHYLNQFFGGIGGEEKANTLPLLIKGKKGPGNLAETLFEGKGQIVATIICGDDFINEHSDQALKEILSMVEKDKPNLFMAGPAFGAGRYGVACGMVCHRVSEELKIPVITGMHVENPAVELFRGKIPIVKTGVDAGRMHEALKKMVKIGYRISQGEVLKAGEEKELIGSGVRRNILVPLAAGERAVNMLVAKLKGLPFETELPLASFDQVVPASPIVDLKRATIALVTTGGIVPKGNPDHSPVGRSESFRKYSIKGMEKLRREDYDAVHKGYDTRYAEEDPNRVVPLDVMRSLEKEGVIGRLHDFFYTLSGQGAYVQSARNIGRSIAKALSGEGVQGAILTST